MYEVKTQVGSYWRRHINQLRETVKKDISKESCVHSKYPVEITRQAVTQCEHQATLSSSSSYHSDKPTELPPSHHVAGR